MASVSSPPEIDYPTTDGRPMAETDHHRDLMVEASASFICEFN